MTVYINGTSGISGVDGSAGTPAIQGTDANTGISFPAADTVAINTGGSERVRTDSSGRLLVGTSTQVSSVSPSIQTARSGAGFVAIANSDSVSSADNLLGQIAFYGGQSGGYGFGAAISATSDATWSSTSDAPARLVFSTTADGASSPTERMRIDDAGQTYLLSTTNAFPLYIGTTNGAGTANALIDAGHSASSITSRTRSFIVYTNGNVQNTNNSYAGISDIKLKENIVDASSQWSDLKALQVRKFNFKKETGQETHTQIGLIAQEVELVSPGLVTKSPDRDAEGNDLGTVTKSVNYSVLYMKAVKALQEAMERIETLEAKVAALEAA